MSIKQSGKPCVQDELTFLRNEKITQKPTKESELEYLSDLLPQLRLMALGTEQETLAYLLELAMLEARTQLELETFAQNVIEGD